MFLYIGIALFILLGSFTKQSKIIYRLSLALLFFVTAFRDPGLGGTDTLIYQEYFALIPKLTELAGYQSKYSVGYTVLNAFVKMFSSEFVVYQMLYTLLCIVLIHQILKQLEINYKEKCLFLFSYFCFRFTWNTWVLLRQNVANLLFWLLLIMLIKKIYKLQAEERKIWNRETILWLGLTIFVPTLFHSSGWINIALLAVFFFLSKISTKKKMIIVPAGCALIYAVGRYVYPILYNFVVSMIDSRYAYFEASINTTSNLFETAFRLVFFLLFAWHYDRENYPYKEFVINAQAIIVLLGSMNVGTFDRMLEYYAIGLYVGMALVLNNFKGKSRLIALGFYGLGMLAILCRFLLIMDNGQFLNYTFWFF